MKDRIRPLLKTYGRIRPSLRVFLDSRYLIPGDDWAKELAQAQRQSTITVVLVSRHSDRASQSEEIATGIQLARDSCDPQIFRLNWNSPAISSNDDPKDAGAELWHAFACGNTRPG
jgi:hypothetical protein